MEQPRPQGLLAFQYGGGMHPAIVSGIVIGCLRSAPVSYWQIFFPVLSHSARSLCESWLGPVPFSFLKLTNNWVPLVPEVFLACGGNFGGWPKVDTSSAVGRRLEKKRFARVTIKTWQKMETALEKSLAPRVITEWHGRNSVLYFSMQFFFLCSLLKIIDLCWTGQR